MNSLLFLGLMFVGTFFLGLNDVLQRRYLLRGVNEQILLGFAWLIVGAISFLSLFIFGIPEIKAGFWPALGATVVLNIISQNVFVRALKLEEASIIGPLRLLTPPFVIITGFFVLNEVPNLWGVMGILTTVVGIWLLFPPERSVGTARNFLKNLSRPGVLLGILGALLFALSFPFDKKAVITSSAPFLTVISFSVVGSSTIILSSFRRDFRNELGKVWVWKRELLFLGFILTLGALLTSQALNYSFASYAASAKRIWAFWTVLLAGRFLLEKNIGRRLLASAVMFSGIIITVFWG